MMNNTTPDVIDGLPIVVVGAHLSGLALNGDLVSRGAQHVKATCTKKAYRLFALATPAGSVPKPGLKRVSDSEDTGQQIDVEVWRLPTVQVASFLLTISHPLGIGSIELEDGAWCHGFICEPVGLEAAGVVDITAFGGWRAYLASLDSKDV